MNKRKYYKINRDRILSYNNERYRSTHVRKYAKCWEVKSPDNSVIQFDAMKSLVIFFGYSESKIRRCIKSNSNIEGYTIRKIV